MEPSIAGRDFDSWLDWSGNADSTIDPPLLATALNELGVNPADTLYPVSPCSTANSDRRRSATKSSFLTASKIENLPTPEQSSSSPEASQYNTSRLSDESARDYPAVAPRPLLKRKLSPQDVPTRPERDAKPPPKKRPHNVIEKRYRANLNAKIAELRDSIPSLRSIKKVQAGEDAGTSDEDGDGLTPSGKFNKASVLAKAVEYIKHLERRNTSLDKDNETLKSRLETLEKVLAQGGNQEERLEAFTSQDVIEKSKSSEGNSENGPKQSHPPQGLIPVPESWRKFRESRSQEHYGQIYDTPSEGSRLKGKWPSRIMFSSLAGLMIMEGLSSSDQGTTSKEKGLFGIPLELLDGYRFLRSPRIYLSAFAQFCRHGGVVPLLKGFMALTILAFFIFAYLFNSKPAAPVEESAKPPRAPEELYLTSPIEVRRRAWSTSMQVLGLPHHHFFKEWMAVTAEWLRYSFRFLFGSQACAWVTGRSADDEIARVKAWDIAIDAQLAGGDPEISRSRVVLTSFGSGTLPRTPLRLMQKALHCRVLMWHVGRHKNSVTTRIANAVGVYFSNREWRRAQQIQETLPNGSGDSLPPYLSALLEHGCNDVFTDAVVQRAYNLMYDRPTAEDSDNRLMDVIVEDHAIRSPLDAIAAWWSSQALEQTLRSSNENSEYGETLQHLQAALRVAPSGSAAQTRALALHALFYPAHRSEYLARAWRALPSAAMSPLAGLAGPYFIDSSTPRSARVEISHILQCIELVTRMEASPEETPPVVEIDPDQMTLLSFVAFRFLLHKLQQLEQSPAPSLLYTTVARTLCSWLHSDVADAKIVPRDLVMKTEDMCDDMDGDDIETRRRLSHDTGYETQEDEDETKDMTAPFRKMTTGWDDGTLRTLATQGDLYV